jgi:hypothetical protein
VGAEGVETVGLDLAGNFRSKAQEDAAAAREAAAALEKLGIAAEGMKGVKSLTDQLGAARAELKRLQDAANVELFAKNPLAKAKHDVEELERALKQKAEAAKKVRDVFDKMVGADKISTGSPETFAGRVRGVAAASWTTKKDSIADQAGVLRGLLANGGKDLEGHATASAVALGGAVGALKMGGEILSSAAAKAKDLLIEGVQYGIEKSAAREKQTSILDKLTRGEGKLAYRVSTELSAATGVDTGTTRDRMKGLIQAHFNEADTRTQIKAAADIGEVLGAGAAESYLGALEKMSHRGKATERDMRAMTGAGVDLKHILAGLAGPSETIEMVETRLKAGKIASQDFARAAAAVVQKDMGGVAGKGLDATVNRLKIARDSLFSGWDTSPLDDLGKRIVEVMSSPVGEELKKSIGEVGAAVLNMSNSITKEDIAQALSAGAAAAHDLAEAIKMARDMASDFAPYAEMLVGVLQTVPGFSAGMSLLPGGQAFAEIGGEMALRERRPAEEGAAKEARNAGKDIAEGYAEGIKEGAPEVAAAVKTTLDAGIEAGNKTLDRHSPSKVYQGMGKDSALGYAKGANDNAGAVEDAGAGIARRAIAGTGGGQAGGGVGGAPAPVVFQINLGGITIEGGAVSRADAEEHAEAIARALEPRLEAAVRRIQRDLTEFTGSLSTRVA